MKSTLQLINLVFFVGALSCQQVMAAPKDSMKLGKVFNYLGPLPIKDESTGELIKSDSNETLTGMPSEQADLEQACWKMISERSVVTFSLQNRVLDELTAEMKNLTMEDEAREAVEKLINRMRKSMNEAGEALKKDAPDEFFDALFDASEDIINLSSLLRDPKLDDTTFLTLVKAVSRLGRNNSALIQEFTEMCSFVQRSPRPRIYS